MKKGLLDIILKALAVWNEKVAEVWSLLTQSPQEFKGGGVWRVISGINTAMQGIGYGLLVLFFIYGFLYATTNVEEIKRPEHSWRFFLRFAVAKAIITYGIDILMAILSIAQGILAEILNYGGAAAFTQVVLPDSIAAAIDEVGTFEAIPLWLVGAVGCLLATVLGFVLILTVYGRFFKFYMFTALSPIPLSTFAAERTENTGKQFLKGFMAVCMEFACVALACIISSALMSEPTVINAEEAAVSQLWGYFTEVGFNMLLLVGTVKACEKIAHEIMGL